MDVLSTAATADFKSMDWFAALRIAELHFEMEDPALWRTVGRILAESMASFPKGHLRDPAAPTTTVPTFSTLRCACNMGR